MTSAPIVRAAVLDDLRQLIRLTHEEPTAPQWTQEQFAEAVLAAIQETASRYVIVFADNNEVLGFIVISATAAEAELESVVVSNKSRRQGIGQKLCVAALEWARKQGADEVWLEVRESNGPARALYKSLKFEDRGKRPRYYRNPNEDAVVMCCVLSGTTHL